MKKLYDEDAIKNIADAIREKNGETTTYKVSEMASAITDITTLDDTTINNVVNRTIVSLDLPSCTKVASYAFCYCSKLTTVNLPTCSQILARGFQICSVLTDVSLPKCTYLGNYAFSSCAALTTLSLPVCSLIGNYTFQHTSLTSLYLLSTSVVNLTGSSAFTSTPIASGSGYVYVPSSLVASYKTASYWSAISNYIVSYTS